jgi:hypothetical protein
VIGPLAFAALFMSSASDGPGGPKRGLSDLEAWEIVLSQVDEVWDLVCWAVSRSSLVDVEPVLIEVRASLESIVSAWDPFIDEQSSGVSVRLDGVKRGIAEVCDNYASIQSLDDLMYELRYEVVEKLEGVRVAVRDIVFHADDSRPWWARAEAALDAYEYDEEHYTDNGFEFFVEFWKMMETLSKRGLPRDLEQEYRKIEKEAEETNNTDQGECNRMIRLIRETIAFEKARAS